MKNGIVGLLGGLWLSACCMGGTGSLLPPRPLRYTPDPWLVNWGETYDSSRLADGNPSTYWCAPAGTPFPIVTILQLDAPSTLASLDFDNRVVGYETSGIREVTIEPLMAGGLPIGAPVHAVLSSNALTTVPLSQTGVSAVRLTFGSNHGGSYAVLAELALRSDMGTGLPPLPAVPGGAPIVGAPVVGAPIVGAPVVGAPVVGAPIVGAPIVGAPGAPPVGAVLPTPATGGTGAPYVVDGAVEAFAGYPTDYMHDGNPATYWCSPPSPYFPFVLTLTLSPPTTVSAVEINTAIAAYPDIGPADVTILTIGPTGAILNVTTTTLPPNTTTRVPLVAPVEAAQLRVTLQGNHGGAFAGIAELAIMP